MANDMGQVQFRLPREDRERIQGLAIDLDITVQSLLEQAVAEFEGKIQRERESGEQVINGVQIIVPREHADTVRTLVEILANPLNNHDKHDGDHFRRLAEHYQERLAEQPRKKNGTNS